MTTSEPPWDVVRRSKILSSADQLLERYFFSDKVPALRTSIQSMRDFLLQLDDQRRFVECVNDALYAVANDRHLRLKHSIAPASTARAQRENDGEMHRHQAYGVEASIRLPANIGYLRLAAFFDMPKAKRAFDGAIQQLIGTDGLIIDLRANRGGDPKTVNYLMGYFLPRQTEVSGFLVKRDGEIIVERMFSGKTISGIHYDSKPVYILTSSGTYSGGEQFAFDMQALGRATLIGGTTAGSANPDTAYRVDDHFIFLIPHGTAHSPYTSPNWEGCGVAPDITTPPGSELRVAYALAVDATLRSTRHGLQERERVVRAPDAMLAALFSGIAGDVLTRPDSK